MAEFSERSILRKLTALRTFFGYLERRGIVSSDPFASISMRKKETRLPSVLTEEEVKDLLSLPRASFREERDHMLFLLIYNSGMRIGEVLSVNIDEIDFPRRRILNKSVVMFAGMSPVSSSPTLEPRKIFSDKDSVTSKRYPIADLVYEVIGFLGQFIYFY